MQTRRPTARNVGEPDDYNGSAYRGKLRQLLKQFNHFMLFVWRLGLGNGLNAWPPVGGRIMILTHTGRDGPGDLARFWPLATFILLPLALWRHRR